MSATTTFPVLEHTYAYAVPGLSLSWSAAPVSEPRLLILNDELATELGLDPEQLRADPALLVGAVPPGVDTFAQAYAGHQFGSYSPRLGDGRALLVGELVRPDGARVDLHLKGSGRTPFARGGDGKAVIGPMLREYLMGEALQALGIPTTRALSVVATGEPVLREGVQPGAVLCRVAASHLRVGTFQYAAATGERELLQALADYAIERHYPEAAKAGETAAEGGASTAAGPGARYLALLAAVVAAQADLVARWMLVGFVHGVMNTDNMAISGQTIDYGPCAMMDRFDLGTVFSSIDHGGRYAYGNQPAIALWNLARFAETLLPLIDEDPDAAVTAATGVLEGFGPRYEAAATRGMAAKLGIPAPGESPDPSDEVVAALIADLQSLLAVQQVDYTGFFRALAAGTARGLFERPEDFDAWAARREALLPSGAAERAAVAVAMNAVNPAYIPRNHSVEEALATATTGDLAPFLRLLEAVRRPYDERPDLEDLLGPAPKDAWPHVTFCGT